MSSAEVRQQRSRTVLPVQLNVVRGPERLPADEQWQDLLRGKLRLLQSSGTELEALLTELSTHLVSIQSEEKTLFVNFETFEELWKFSTYHVMGLLGPGLENVLFDPRFWLGSLEEGDDDIAIGVSVPEETLDLVYRDVLMQEGSLFGSCTSSQVFDSSTSGGDLHLEQGDVAQFKPSVQGSGWNVLCLASGARGTRPELVLEPVQPFHQWVLKSDSESFLVGHRKPACDFPSSFARGMCSVSERYDAEGPDQLSLDPADRVQVQGVLVSGLNWFTGRKEFTGEVGLVQTGLVAPLPHTDCSMAVPLDAEESGFLRLHLEAVLEETVKVLKTKSQNDVVHSCKLDLTSRGDLHSKYQAAFPCAPAESLFESQTLKEDLLWFLDEGKESVATITATVKGQESPTTEDRPQTGPPSFKVYPVEPLASGNHQDMENFATLFSFLEGRDYRAELGSLYSLSSDLLASSIFNGQSDQDELVGFLSAAREAARKKRLFWTQTRLCFLLGRLCSGRSKFSQARVYLEECLVVPQESFTDFRLLASIYSNLVAIYLMQKNAESFFSLVERLAALLMGFPECLDYLADNTALRYVLKKSILCHDTTCEAWSLHTLAKYHWNRDEMGKVVPYLERLLVLRADAQTGWIISLSDGYQTLARLYKNLELPHLSVGAAKKASKERPPTLTHCLSTMTLALDQVNKLNGITEQVLIPPQAAPYLHHSLSLLAATEGEPYDSLKHHLTFSLCQIFCKHGMMEQAIRCMHGLVRSRPRSQQQHHHLQPQSQQMISAAERHGTLVWLAWLHIEKHQPDVALQILDSVLASLPEHCTVPPKGVILNMRGVALRCMGNFHGAAESYRVAVNVCQESKDVANSAVAQANQGLLFLRAGAKRLARRHLLEAVRLFAELDPGHHEEIFIQVLLELGTHYVKHGQMGYGAGCYQWALLLSIAADLLECQLMATKDLCRLYGHESPDQALCITYSLHQVVLLRHSRDREQEGDALEAVSRLYLTVATERAYRAALDSTKSSLGIFIDLGCRQKEALGWLQAGTIHLLLQQAELTDLYVQAAQGVALSTGDSGFLLKVLEAAGDLFFNSRRDRLKAVPLYRDGAMVLAEQIGCAATRLRLSHKLAALLLHLQAFGEALEFGQVALELSITAGERLGQRVAYHRLALIYQRLDRLELAEHHYLQALALCPSPLRFTEETLYYVAVYQTLGDIIFYRLKDPFDAAGYYNLALAAALDLGHKRAQLELCIRLATVYHNFLSDRELSLFFYSRARALASQLNAKRRPAASLGIGSAGSPAFSKTA